jgi:hypothetical protein
LSQRVVVHRILSNNSFNGSLPDVTNFTALRTL